MYKDLAKLYPDIVWAHLIPLRGTSEFTPPPDLPQLQCHRVIHLLVGLKIWSKHSIYKKVQNNHTLKVSLIDN